MIWNRVKEDLKTALPENIYHLWIEPLVFEHCRGEIFYLATPDLYFSAYVKQNFTELIEKTLENNGLANTTVRFCQQQKTCSKKVVTAKKKKGSNSQMRLPSVPRNESKYRNLHPRYTFDEFMVGDSNILAESACRSMVAEDGLVGPCLYINSDTGLGKSHLTHAVAHQVIANSPMTRLYYLTAKQFAAEMIQGIQTKTMVDFKTKYQENCDILLVEDVHSLTGKKKTQEELNDVLDSLIKGGKRVILTSKKAPRDLVDIDSEFLSRMSSGLVTTIKAPDIDTRRRIIEKKAIQHQLFLDDELIGFLAGHIRGDVRKIESALFALRANAQVNGGRIDLDLVQKTVAAIVGQHQELTAAMVCEMVSSEFKVSIAELQSKSRKKTVTQPRQIAMYLSRKYTDDSLADIGKLFNRDHSTVLHSIKVVATKLVRDASINAQLEILSEKVKQL